MPSRRQRRLAITATATIVGLLSVGHPRASGGVLQERPPDWDIELAETWVSAAERHTPGHIDSALVSLAHVQGDDVRRLWISIQVLLRFVDNPSIGRVRMPAPPGRDLRGGSVSREVVHRITSDERRRLSALLPRIRQLTRPGLLMRAIIAHTDIVTLDGGLAALPPGQPTTASDPMRVMVGDGQARELQFVSRHWGLARQVVSVLRKAPDEQRFVRDWYRATLAFQQWHESFDANHLRAALRAVPNDAVLLFLAGCHHEVFASPVFQGIARAYRGRFRLEISSPDRELSNAERYFRRALAVDAAHREARLRLGRILVQRGRVDAGLVELDAAIDANTDPAIDYYGSLFLGDAHEARGDVATARQWYERAATSNQGARLPHLALARLARERGDTASSLDRLRHAVAPPVSDAPVEPWWTYRHVQARTSLVQLDELRRRVTVEP